MKRKDWNIKKEKLFKTKKDGGEVNKVEWEEVRVSFVVYMGVKFGL